MGDKCSFPHLTEEQAKAKANGETNAQYQARTGFKAKGAPKGKGKGRGGGNGKPNAAAAAADAAVPKEGSCGAFNPVVSPGTQMTAASPAGGPVTGVFHQCLADYSGDYHPNGS